MYAVYTKLRECWEEQQGSVFTDHRRCGRSGVARAQGARRLRNPVSKRLSFPVESGHPEKVGEKWQAIGARGDLENTYLVDYERYHSNGEIEILV